MISKYEYAKQYETERHVWSVVGNEVSLHLHISKHEEFTNGGLEIHYRMPPVYMRDKPPSHNICAFIACPCWHDGSSSWASDYWIPLWEEGITHDEMFALLEVETARRSTEFREDWRKEDVEI